MMLVVVFALLIGVARSEYTATCYNGNKTSVSVRPSTDGIGGRYEVFFCTEADRSVTNWQLQMSFVSSPDEHNCTYEQLGERRAGTGIAHSSNEELISLDLDCTRVCFSKYMDLMFRGCYRLQNKLIRGQFSSEIFNTFYYADNNIPGPEYFGNATFVKDLDYDKIVIFNWYLGHIPLTEYDIQMKIVNGSHDEWVEVRDNCSSSPGVLRCDLRPAEGCYDLRLTHYAPWTTSHLFEDYKTLTAHFCQKPVAAERPPLEREGAGAGRSRVTWAVAGSAGALLAAALGALLGWHSRLARKLRRRVQHYWLASAVEQPPPPPAGGPLLLLYAREGPALEAAVRALRELLAALGAPALDVHSAEALAQAAAAPAAWARLAVCAPHSRVLLLQTPALACLAAAPPPDDHCSLQLREPLLPGRAVYRSPQFGDTLLQYALRLLADGPAAIDPAARPYTKFYLATFPELATEVFPYVVPFRRYELPAAAGQLARDVGAEEGPDPQQQAQLQRLLDEFSAAVASFVHHVRHNEDYLADQLMFL